MISAKKNFKVTKRITKQSEEEGYEKITDAPNYKGNLQAIVIKDRKFKKKRKSNQPEYAYFTSLPWKNALFLYEAYRRLCIPYHGLSNLRRSIQQ